MTGTPGCAVVDGSHLVPNSVGLISVGRSNRVGPSSGMVLDSRGPGCAFTFGLNTE